MMEELWVRIEEASLNAWPAPQGMVYDGWLLRFAGGYTKRANSVNPRYPSRLYLDQKITVCEAAYVAQGLPCLFRLADPFTPPELCQALVDARYHGFEPTLVLGQKIGQMQQESLGVQSRLMAVDNWIRLRATLTGTSLSQWEMHRRILNCIAPQKALIGLFIDERPVACGMGVVEGHLLGYFSIYTVAEERRKGYAGMVMAALDAWGAAYGATYGYLQVEGDNEPALALYDGLGFERCYRYVYFKKKEMGN